MKLSIGQLKKIIKEEIQILENEQEFDPSVSNEQFNHIRDLLTYDFQTGLMFLQSGLGIDSVPEQQKKELAKAIWDNSVGYKESPEYVREMEQKKAAVHHGDHDAVDSHKKKLAAMDREFGGNVEDVGELMGLGNPYSDMMSIAHRGKFAFEYFYDQLKQKGIL